MSKEKTVNAIVQARMGSTRLPGKVLMEIEGVPILEHVVRRLNSVRRIDNIVVATSIQKEDDSIESFCLDKQINCVRGSEENVLERFGLASSVFPSDIYIRATADNPMIDVRLIEDMISFFETEGLTYTCYKSFPIGSGVEIFSNLALKMALEYADKPFELEHVTPFMYQRMEGRKVKYYMSDVDDSQIRMTVDTEKDLRFAKEVFSKLYMENQLFGISEVKDLLSKDDKLRIINMDVHQKTLGE